MKVLLLVLALLCIESASSRAQFPTGAGHPELTWSQIETEHFTLIYHEGLDSIVREAAPLAEEVYRVVTTNLRNPLDHKVKIYFSDNDEVKNAFANSDDHIFIWMRGILDDLPYSIRSSGTSKWLRSVLTHEFTHTVIYNATKDPTDLFIATGGVPRWFNEGTARFMEPDGWTSDIDMVLRVATVSSKLSISSNDFLAGTLVYEGGHSIVRYITATYGDSALARIIHRDGLFYNFEKSVQRATKHSLGEILTDWRRTLNVYYNTQYGQKQETKDFARKIPAGLPIVLSSRVSPDGKKFVMYGKRSVESPAQFYIMRDDSLGRSDVLLETPGLEQNFSWSPDSRSIVLSKMHFGAGSSLLYDLYTFNLESESLERLTTNARIEQPDWSPKGDEVVASQSQKSGSDLVAVNLANGAITKLTKFNDPNVSVYWPRFSPDGSKIAFSIFRKNGMRDVAMIERQTGEITYLTSDSANDRYPVWSPHGDSIVFISHQNGVPNVFGAAARTAQSQPIHQITDVAGGLTVWDWSAQKDSLLVSSADDRNQVNLYWMSPHGTVHSAPPVALAEKYTAWKSVRMPLVTPPQDSAVAATVSNPESYSSLAHIKPLVFLPLLSTDLGKRGNNGTRFGVVGALSDPMGKHNIVIVADWGDVSKQPGVDISYSNLMFKPALTLHYGNTLSYNSIIDSKPYYQKDVTYGVGVDLPLLPPDALDRAHVLSAGAAHRTLSPWNLQDFESTPIERKPIRTTLLNIGASYGFASPWVQTSLAFTHADRKLQSDLTYSRWRAALNWRAPLDEAHKTFFGVNGRALAQFGDEVPQEFIGFTPYDIFEGGFSVLDLQANDRLRGIRRYYYGNRLVIGSAELTIPDFFFQNVVSILRGFDPSIVGFFDIGSVWYGSRPANNQSVQVLSLGQTRWLKTAGFELRSTFAPGTWMAGGVGWEIKDAPKPDFYFRLSTAF